MASVPSKTQLLKSYDEPWGRMIPPRLGALFLEQGRVQDAWEVFQRTAGMPLGRPSFLSNQRDRTHSLLFEARRDQRDPNC